jgi:C-terminal processing protease CtpA/Prc
MHDVLVSVDGTPVKDLSDDAIANLVIGQADTKVSRL